jgi:two-component sensor histidine kinase
VRAIATVHQRLYQSGDVTSVDAGDYLGALVAELRRTYEASNVALSAAVEAPAIRLGTDAAIPCGLIVNELVTNAIKHAFPDSRRGAVRVLVRRTEKSGLLLTVVDDGVGFPAALDFRQTPTLGLKLVCMLAGQLKGDLQCLPGPGTKFALRFDGELPHD